MSDGTKYLSYFSIHYDIKNGTDGRIYHNKQSLYNVFHGELYWSNVFYESYQCGRFLISEHNNYFCHIVGQANDINAFSAIYYDLLELDMSYDEKVKLADTCCMIISELT